MKSLFFIVLLTLSTVVKASNMDAAFMFGPSLTQTGDIQDLGDPNMNIGFDFNYYFNEHHGLGASTTNEFGFDGTSRFRDINDASIHTFEVHYALKFNLHERLKLAFMPGFGWQTIFDEQRDYYWGYSYYDDISTAWIWNYKLLLDYRVTQWKEGDYFFLGGGIMQVFSLNDSLRGQDISGSRMSFLFRMGLEF